MWRSWNTGSKNVEEVGEEYEFDLVDDSEEESKEIQKVPSIDTVRKGWTDET